MARISRPQALRLSGATSIGVIAGFSDDDNDVEDADVIGSDEHPAKATATNLRNLGRVAFQYAIEDER